MFIFQVIKDFFQHLFCFCISKEYRRHFFHVRKSAPEWNAKAEAVQKIDAALDPAGPNNHRQRRVIKAKLRKYIKQNSKKSLEAY